VPIPALLATSAIHHHLVQKGLRTTTGLVVETELGLSSRARSGSASFHGVIGAEGEGDHVALSLVGDAVAGTIWYGDQLYGLFHAPTGETILVERHNVAPGACALGPEHRVPSRGQAAGRTPSSGGGSQGGTSDVASDLEIIDVVTAYTTQARQASGGTNQVLALIDLAVLETNLSYDNCDAGLQLRLVYADEVSYTESGSMSTDLSRLRSKNDGNMDEVHGWRDVYGGDAVSLIVSGGGACGVAYLMTNVSQGFQSSAFSVVARGCATGYYSYGHELGHNFGCAHDDDNAGSSSHNYAYGYRTPNNAYRPASRFFRAPTTPGTAGSWASTGPRTMPSP